MSQEEIASIIGIVKDVVTGAAAFVAATVAVRGLKAWRVQLHGKTEYELARRILLAVYEVENKISMYRNFVMTAGEMLEAAEKAGIKRPEGDTTEFMETASRAARNQRWGEVFEALAVLRKEMFEARAMWTEAALKGAGELEAIVRDLYVAHNRYLRHATSPRPRVSPEQLNQIDLVVFDHGDQASPDAFTNRVSDAVKKVEAELRPKLTISK